MLVVSNTKDLDMALWFWCWMQDRLRYIPDAGLLLQNKLPAVHRRQMYVVAFKFVHRYVRKWMGCSSGKKTQVMLLKIIKACRDINVETVYASLLNTYVPSEFVLEHILHVTSARLMKFVLFISVSLGWTKNRAAAKKSFGACNALFKWTRVGNDNTLLVGIQICLSWYLVLAHKLLIYLD